MPSKIQWTKRVVPLFPEPFEFPDFWSDNAVEIAVRNYFVKGKENSLQQVVDRVVQGVVDAAQCQNFRFEKADRLRHFLLFQMGAFNSPVWFNLGVNAAPQVSACFIQSVEDNVESIYKLLASEARLFRMGSGSGTNFSRIANVMPVLETFDKSAQSSRSGGGHRRAAKMVCLDFDHPQILDFVRWKVLEERKARVLLQNGYSGGMDGEALRSVSGQNSNNSVRVSDEFLKDESAPLLKEMAQAAWESADPGLHFSDTISKWHTCKISGPIRASNPCSEFVFLEDSACNLASLNLLKFWSREKGFDWPLFDEAVEVFLTAQEILVDFASYPTEEIARVSHDHRPLGLGYANLGGLLMAMGLPYDSAKARDWAAQITERLHMVALKTSAFLAKEHGTFSAYEKNKKSVLDVMEMHQKAGSLKEWDGVLKQIHEYGLRNAQVTLIAPTGTIGLFMDCATLGIEPEYSLLKHKIFSGGGSMKIVNSVVDEALISLGYDPAQREEIQKEIEAKGHPFESEFLRSEHHSVFHTAVPPKNHPEARISADGHLEMMAAVQPFLSGSISKTVNLPARSTPEDIKQIFLKAHRLGLKSISVYRDGSKSVQPLSCLDC